MEYEAKSASNTIVPTSIETCFAAEIVIYDLTIKVPKRPT